MNAHDAVLAIARRHHEYRKGEGPAAIIVLAIVGVIMLFAWYFSAAEVAKRELRATRRWKIGEMPEDTRGKIVGTARAAEAAKTLIAPISGRACVAYSLYIKEGSGKHTKTLVLEKISVPFYVEDGTGRALVDATEGMLLMESSPTSAPKNAAPTPAQQAMLQRHPALNKTWVELMRDGDYWYERRIDVGEKVSVMGSGLRKPDPDGPVSSEYRGASPTRLRMNGTREEPVIISDDPSTTI